jgi:lauroyl/myristoyl acyltransferase
MNLAKLLCLWPDRLGEPPWHNQCRCTGMDQFEETWARGRPVVLAVLHFGPLAVLRFWMRARGLPIAALMWRKSKHRPLYRRYLDRICDHVGGVPGLRHVFGLDELREVSRFLQPGRLLIVTVEANDAKHVLVKGDDFHFRMATGALRLAARADAHVVPCLIRADQSLGFTIHFGKPVPAAWVGDKCQYGAACNHLLHEFLPVLRDQPEQSGYELLGCFQTAAP